MKVQELTKQFYKDYLDLSNMSQTAQLELTKEIKDKPIFEAAAKYNDLFVRADILIPNNEDYKIEDYHISDIAFQKYVFEKANFKINKTYIMFINNKYKREQNLDINQLFIKQDITAEVEQYKQLIEQQIKELSKINNPEININQNCLSPFPCPYKSICWNHLKANNVTELFYGKSIGYSLLKQNITEIKNIPESTKLKYRPKQQKIQIEATKNNQIYINKSEIKNFIETLNYPIYHFDFETYASAIPIFKNSYPYQQIPFQFSLHIEQKDGTISHHEFLETTNQDPRINLMKAMKETLGQKGTILVYNQSFEKKIIKDLARDFPKFQEEANNYLERINDLAIPFQNFNYYNPLQRGRYSIKVILPIFSSLSYKEMQVSNGEEAFITYENIAFNNPDNKEQLIESLKEYCKQDTLAEIKILNALKDIIDISTI
jgi:hypothetical protein